MIILFNDDSSVDCSEIEVKDEKIYWDDDNCDSKSNVKAILDEEGFDITHEFFCVGKNTNIADVAQYWIHDYIMYALYLGDSAKFTVSPNSDSPTGVRKTGDDSGYLINLNYNNQGIEHLIMFQITSVGADRVFVQGGVGATYVETEMNADSAIELLLSY